MEIEFFINPSPAHKVKSEASGFSIEPLSMSDHDMKSFQPIAKKAIAYPGSDYIVKAHPNSDVGGYDEVTFFKT